MLVLFSSLAYAASVAIFASGSVAYDLQKRLMESDQLSPVDTFQLDGSNMTVENLANYDVVWVASENYNLDADDVGDVLADYLDAGGGVIVAPPSIAGWWLDGRFISDGYAPYEVSEGAMYTGAYSWLVADVEDHPVLEGVGPAGAGAAANVFTIPGVANGATLVAHWDRDSAPAVGLLDKGWRTAFFTLTPASSEVQEGYYDITTDVPVLIVNLTLWAAGDIDTSGGDDSGGAGSGADDCFDCDGDGYDDSVDCNDKSAAIHPGADEVDDGLDNDCDGEADGAGATTGCNSTGAPVAGSALLALAFLRRRGRDAR